MRVVLLTNDRKTAQAYTEAAEQTGVLRLCILKNTAQVLERLFRDPFDALLSDDLSVFDARIRKCPVLWPDNTFLLIEKPIEALRLPRDLTFCFLTGSDPKDVLLSISRFFPMASDPRFDTETAISRFLQQTGVPVSLSGFACLRIALRILLSMNDLFNPCLINELYSILSETMGISVYVAEHAIRHAVDAAWIRADTSLLDKLFGYTVRSDRGAPSNAAFLFRAADHIRMMREDQYDTRGNA